MKKSKITEIKWLTHFIISRNKIRVCPPVAFTPTESNTFPLVCLVPDLCRVHMVAAEVGLYIC